MNVQPIQVIPDRVGINRNTVFYYFKTNEGMTATEEEIIQIWRENLASYMKPTSVDFVEELPKAPTGKVFKRELREQYWAEEGRRVGGV